MSLPKPDLQATFFDASYLAGELFEPTDRYAVFRQRILPALRAIRQGLCEGPKGGMPQSVIPLANPCF